MPGKLRPDHVFAMVDGIDKVWEPALSLGEAISAQVCGECSVTILIVVAGEILFLITLLGSSFIGSFTAATAIPIR
jgi:hypothetical protein